MGDLPERVHTGVSAPGPGDLRFGTHHFGKAFLKHPLNGPLIRLNLPSGEGSAVILEGEFDTFQGHSHNCSEFTVQGSEKKNSPFDACPEPAQGFEV
jgi:hypothetical protein